MIKKQSEAGFSLIEISMILIIFGLLLTAILKTATFIRSENIRSEYFDTPRLLGAALEEYALINGRYPTPAAADLDITDVNYGVPVPVANLPDFLAGECNSGEAAVNGVICRIGQRDLDNPADGIGEDLEETILIGSLPTTVLGLNSEESFDMHNVRFTYAISSSLTNTATFSNQSGVIRVRSYEGAMPDALGTNSNVHYVVISHGYNQAGAYRSDGTRVACPPSLGALEVENCNDDSTFMALTRGDGTAGNINFELGRAIQNAGTQFLDDSLFFTAEINTDIWTVRGFSGINMTSGVDDGNTRILLGATDFTGPTDISHPTQPEEPQAWINGSARGDALISERICEEGQDSCFRIADIATPGSVAMNEAGGPKNLRCIERGLKSVTRASHITGKWGKRGANGEADGTCDPETSVIDNRNTLIGANTMNNATGIICANGASGIDINGGLICN